MYFAEPAAANPGRVGFADAGTGGGGDYSGFGGGGGGGSATGDKKVKMWDSAVFTADMCESLVRSHEVNYGDYGMVLRAGLEELLARELSDNLRTGIIQVIQALQRSELIFRRRQQHLAWHIPFHLARIVDELCKQMHTSSVGDVHIFPFECMNPSLIVVHHNRPNTFDAGVINVNPTSTEYLPFSAERPPKVLMQTVLELKNIPKARITSEAFWAANLLADGACDMTCYTHIIPWLNQKTHGQIIADSKENFATGSKSENGNLWKAFIHAIKYVLRKANVPKAEIKMFRVLIKQKLLQQVKADLEEEEDVSHSTRLIIRAALHNVSLCLTRNVKHVPEEEFTKTRALIDDIDKKIEALPCPDVATTQPPPTLNLTEGWDKVQKPTHLPLAECHRRIEDVEHFIGTAVEQPRYVPVNFLKIPEKVSTFDEALAALDEVVGLCTRITQQLNVVKTGGFLIVSLLSHIFLEVFPQPVGPKSAKAGKACLWNTKIKYGQQLHCMKRLWQCTEFFLWSSFSIKTTKEFDSQRIVVLGCIATIGDRVIRLLATDFPSIISVHLNGYKRKAPYVITPGKMAGQTENAVTVFPQIAARRSEILDYHQELCEDVPSTNVMWAWEDGWDFCKATQQFLNQVCTVEGFPRNTIMQYFNMEAAGIKCVMGRYWEEYRYHRDLYIAFKWMMAPKTRMPNCTGCMECMVHSPEVQTDYGNHRLQVKYLHREVFAKALQLRWPSFAIPSKFTNPFDAGTEDDILHIKNLTTFDDVMGQRDSELLLSYLTTPYIRIPLVLAFFATEDRVSCLGQQHLRQILEAVLFEPAKFLPRNLNDTVPAEVPADDPGLLATPLGLMLNELQFSPTSMIEPLMRLVKLGREMDAGTVHNQSVVDLILFLVRVVARVENYIAFYLQLADQKAEMRGIKWDPANVAEVRSEHAKLRETIMKGFIPMMEAWNNELMAGMSNWAENAADIDRATRTSANLHAHIILLLRNLPKGELDSNTVSLLTSSIMFLTARHTWNNDSLPVPETELFDVMQVHRRRILHYLYQRNPSELSYIMDSTVRLATSTGKRTEGTSFQWGFVAGEDCVGRFTRVDAETLKRAGYDSKRTDLQRSLDFGFRGKEQLDLVKGIEAINEGLQDVEINIHILSLTFKASHLVALPSEIAGMQDVREIFLEKVGKNDAMLRSMQCAIVQDAEHRQWVRLVGQEHDIQYWKDADPRVPLPTDGMRFFPEDLTPSEEWIYNLVEPVRRTFFLRSFWMPPIFLLLPEHKLGGDQSMVVLSAVCSKSGRKLKEIVAYRDYSTVHVYDLFSIGRRFYRRLIYSSDAHFCHRELQPETSDRKNMWKKWERHAAGEVDADETDEPEESVVLLRHPTHPDNLSKSIETFLPRRILEGLVPDALLETHRFWQDPDDNIRGYPKDANATHLLWMHWRDADYEQLGGHEKQTCFQIFRFAIAKTAPKASEQAVLKSQKMNVTDDIDEEFERLRTTSTMSASDDDADDGMVNLSSGMYRQSSTVVNVNKESSTVEDLNLLFVNLLNAREGTPLNSIAKVFARIELLSHVLCWTTDVEYYKRTAADDAKDKSLTIDLVQLPRLKLSFSARLDADGNLQLFSLDHAHLFVSNLRQPLVCQQLQGIPHSVILADVNQSVSILVPALEVIRPIIINSPFSTELVVNRDNEDWYKKLDTRYYLYPVHVSMSFMFTPTLASALYLLVLRFLHCEYEEVFKLASTIGTDVEFSPEERQNFNMLDFQDVRPEAHACRAKIGLLVADSPVQLCWFLPLEVATMIRSSPSISMNCRLSESEERRLLYVCNLLLQKVEIVHDCAKKVKEDLIDTMMSRAQENLPMFETASPSERRQMQTFYKAIAAKLRESLGIRISKDDITRLFVTWGKFRRFQELHGYYKCLIDNRLAFLDAEAKAIETGTPQEATYVVPPMGKDELWQYYREYNAMGIKVPEAQGKLKNDENRFVTLSEEYDFFYCGAEVRKAGMCKCKDCGENCGPSGGCPCPSCEKFNKNNLQKLLFVPAVPSTSQRMLSFYDAFNWIETMYSEDTSVRDSLEFVPPELRVTSARCRRTTMRDDQNSFLRYYEMLTGTTRVRIGSGDCSKDLATLMFPLCHEARRPESALGHIMHYMMNNPQIWSKLPKYNRTSKQSHENRMSQIYAAIMQHAASNCKYPSDPPELPPRAHKFTVTVTPRATVRRDPLIPILATRILPNLSNTDCTLRTWKPTDLKQLDVKDEKLEVTEETRQQLRGQLLASVVPKDFLCQLSRKELKLHEVDEKLAFDLKKHDAGATSVAKSMILRLENDMKAFAKAENDSKSNKLSGLASETQVKALIADPDGAKKVIAKLQALGADLTKLRDEDTKYFTDAFKVVERTVNAMPVGEKGSRLSEALMHLRRMAHQEAELGLSYVISCLTSTTAESDWQQLNPFLTDATCAATMSLLTTALLRANRVGHINRAAEGVKELIALLQKAIRPPPVDADHEHVHAMKLAAVALTLQKADSLAGQLATKRVYIADDFSYDPRFLIFEYTWNLVLRGRQKQLIKEIHASILDNQSIVKQMIMGAGKTTVVGPLLALMLADSKNLVIQVVPPALLDFTRSILRGTFSCVIQKQIFCFTCDRATEIDSEVLNKFEHAKNSRGIVVTTPSSIKSMFLKYVEGLDRIDDTSRPWLADIDKEVVDLGRCLSVWRDAVLIMDEVDMLLHPLKSELNFPIGAKHDIDFAPLRWKLPMHLIDALFYFQTHRVSVSMKESPESKATLNEVAEVLRKGLRSNALQGTPHLTLLNLDFYEKEMKKVFAKWLLLFLKAQHFAGLSDADTIEYICTRPSRRVNAELNDKIGALEPDHVKTLNLAYDWICAFLPHTMQKIDRVSFGIMSPEDQRRAKEDHPNMPRSRFVTAIPFIGKDLPSSSSEFAHPDVVIGLTILAYRYEGLRPSDFTDIMRQVHAQVEKEVGRFHQRRTNIMYNKWIQAAGGRLLQAFKYDEKKKEEEDTMGMQPSETLVFDDEGKAEKTIDVLPLKLMKQANKDESDKLFKLFKRTPEVIHWYLNESIFPIYMRHQQKKLSASGQELGGDIMFRRRIGFSGTPSDLLPKELGSCEYEPGTDGKLVHTLTNPHVMSYTLVEAGWTVRQLLDTIANASPPFHALIDTGALITGMSNLQVAQYLLKHGLKSAEGVVFLDEMDRKMILVRATGRVLKLAECGIPKIKRFAFYDQVHTTGMDIDHTPNAQAIQTLGKDMVFRDFAQGAYRMRGISQGQTVNIMIIPEVYDLINRTLQSMRAPGEKPDLKPEHVLRDVTAWLLVNSIRSEHVQHNQLCLQTISNVWRKEAFQSLDKARIAGEFVKGGKVADGTQRALNVYREPVDYNVPKTVPQPRMFSETVSTYIKEHTEFITTEVGKAVVGAIAEDKRREDEVDNPVIDVQMVQEQEEEREAEQEAKIEHEIEMEKFVDLAYSRDEEMAVPWAVASLRDFTRAQQFYRLCDFHLYKRRPLEFPESVMLSRNFFSPKWSGHRRIKNVIVNLEWIPDTTALAPLDRSQRDYGAVEAKRAAAALAATLKMVGEHQGGVTDDLAKDFVSIAMGISAVAGAQSVDITDADWAALKGKRGAEEFLKLFTANYLRDEEAGRYTVGLSLAEAETLRRVIHCRRLRDEPFIEGHHTEVALRNATANNTVIDASAKFVAARRAFQQMRNYQCLRFFDCDLHYSDMEINYLMRSVHQSPEKMRQAFFMQVIACRRRAAQRWEKTPVSILFDLPDPFTLLHQKAIGLCMRRELDAKELHLGDAFLAMNHSHCGQLLPDEVWGSLRWCRMQGVTAGDVLDFIQVADTHHEGTIQYPDFLALLTGSSDIADDEDNNPAAAPGGEPNKHLPVVPPYGADELKTLKTEREKERRRLESEASAALATEDKRIREEIEQEQMKEELAMVQTAVNPKLGDANLHFNLQGKDVPKLSQWYGKIVPKQVDEADGAKYFSFQGDSSMRVLGRAIKLLNQTPWLKQYMVTTEFCIPRPASHSGKQSKQPLVDLLNDEVSEDFVLFAFETNTWQYSPQKSSVDVESEASSEHHDSDSYCSEDDGDDDDGEEGSGNRKGYVFATADKSKKSADGKPNRLRRIRVGDLVTEQVGERLSTTSGGTSIEWMKILKPVAGWVPVEEGGSKQFVRERVLIKFNKGTITIDNLFSTTEKVEALLPNTVFEEKKKEEEDDDFGFWTQWQYFDDEEPADEEDEDEDDDGGGMAGGFDGVLHEMREQLRDFKRMKVGDKVVRNAEDWGDRGNEDGGEGNTGKVIKVEDNSVVVQWPNGNKGTYKNGEAGKFELRKVASANEDDDDLGREVSNDDKWGKLLRQKGKNKCRQCNTAIMLEQGWFKCNQCPQVSLCKKCFKAQEHEEHDFTDMLALSELLKTSQVVSGSMVRICVKEPRLGWGDAPRDGTPGVVIEMDEEEGTVQVNFNDETWNGMLDEVEVVDPKYEAYGTQWLGTVLNLTGQDKTAFPAMAAVIEQALIPPKVEGKFKVGDKVKAKWKRGKVHPGEIRAVLPGKKYAVAFDDGDFEPQQAEDEIEINPFTVGVRVRLKRLASEEDYNWGLCTGVKPGTTGEVKRVESYAGERLKLRVQIRNGTRVVQQNLTDEEVEVVGKGKWLVQKDTEAKMVPVPNAANIIMERGFGQGVVSVDCFIRDANYKVNFEDMTLLNSKTDEVVGKVARDPAEPWVRQKETVQIDDGKWHVLTMLVKEHDPSSEAGDVVFFIDGKDVPLDMAIDDLVGDDEVSDDDEDGADEPEGEEEYADRVFIPETFDAMLRDLLAAKPEGADVYSVLLACLEKMEAEKALPKGDTEIVTEMGSRAGTGATGMGSVVKTSSTAKAAGEDEGGDEGEEGEECIETDDDAAPGKRDGSGDEEDAEDEADEDDEESEGCSDEEDAEDAMSKEDDDEDLRKQKKGKKVADKPRQKASESSSASEESASDEEEGDDDDDDDEEDEEGSEAGSDDSGRDTQALKKLKRTVADVMKLDVRNPVSVLPFMSDDVSRMRTKYTSAFPIRKVAMVELAWNEEATAERAKEIFERIDKETQWRCQHCTADNSRLLSECAKCKRERFETEGAEHVKSKVASCLPKSRKATEWRKRMHQKLKSNYEEMLARYDEAGATAATAAL